MNNYRKLSNSKKSKRMCSHNLPSSRFVKYLWTKDIYLSFMKSCQLKHSSKSRTSDNSLNSSLQSICADINCPNHKLPHSIIEPRVSSSNPIVQIDFNHFLSSYPPLSRQSLTSIKTPMIQTTQTKISHSRCTNNKYQLICKINSNRKNRSSPINMYLQLRLRTTNSRHSRTSIE